MKAFFVSILCIISMGLCAADFTPATTPSTTMQSVNNASYMSSGSTYTSNVYEVGAYSPAAHAPARAPRKTPPGTDNSGYDPNNPQFAPIGDAVLPLLLMAVLFAGITCLRNKRRRATQA
ncbi:MAG: hypothetical protein IJ581_00205 [Paludibacteraceae bacterium]|nr:hypothetical protein [Paludibacteraceae bacterium]